VDEDRVAADRDEIAPGDGGSDRFFRRRDRRLVEQLAQEGRLGQELDVEERRLRLQRDRRQLFAAMEPVRGVDVADRDGEDQLPGEPAEPAAELRGSFHPPPADDVVAPVDRRQ
jgi:hypothetical protein